MLAYGVVPVLRAVHFDYYDIFLSLARDRLGADWTSTQSKGHGNALGGDLGWGRLLGRLRELRGSCHPEVDMTVLAYLDKDCNVE